MAKKKVLLMGKAQSGKTSMRSIIFANYLARDTMRLSPTLEMEHHHVRFLGNLVLNLWDCGGQDAFYESYFERDREMIFRSVELLIYVFDIESDHPEKDIEHYSGVLEAIEENSPDARIFVLIHKFDLVAEEERDAIFADRRKHIEDHSRGLSLTCFRTSIWDETLYKAWSEIVTCLIPNINLLKSHLNEFCQICDADEGVLFEKATFLVISHATIGQGGGTGGGRNSGNAVANRRSTILDAHRFEKISNIIKQFKLSCGKTQAQFEGMEVRNSMFSAFLDAFTTNTYIMVIVSDPRVESATMLANIKGAKKHFDAFIPRC
jgi:Ras-related GTP-binding protein A/B